MKYRYLICSLLMAKALFASDALTSPSIQDQSSLIQTEKFQKNSEIETIPYLKLGASPIYGSFSFGCRFKNEELKKATDHSLNLYVFSWDSISTFSYKYSRIKYTGDSGRYGGVGFEGILEVFKFKYFSGLPNIEFFTGKEFGEKGHRKWVQVGVNVVPIAYGILALAEFGVSPYSALFSAITAISAVNVSFAF